MTEYIPKFEDDLERAYSRETLDRINQEVGLLINTYVDIKYMQLSRPVYDKVQHLPFELAQNYLEKELFKVNNLIEEEPQWTMFKRPLLFVTEKFVTEKQKQTPSDNKYTDLEHLINGFSYMEVYDYLNYPDAKQFIDSRELSKYSAIGSRLPINLPKINELIDYLAYLKHYSWLVKTFGSKTVEKPILNINFVEKQEINTQQEIKLSVQHNNYIVENTKIVEKPILKETALPLNINLSKEQQNKLFERLKKDGYIAEDTHKESFLWAFGNQEKPIKNWTPIKWFDIPKRTKKSNAQTLYELLYLLKFDNKHPDRYKGIGYCFRDSDNEKFEHMSQKNPHKSKQDTSGKRQLKKIVDEVKALSI